MFQSLVSIIIPVHNGENYLRDAIDSALAQTYPHCEVIVVNDGSTDGGATEGIALSYGGRIRYCRKENGGVSTALNRGVREMRGDYFSWLAHDDMYYPHKTELQMAALGRSRDKTAIVHGNYDLMDVKRGAISPMRQEDGYGAERLANSVFPLLMATLHAATPLMHRSVFERVGLFDEDLPLTQDYDFLFRAMRGRRSIFLREPLLLSRLHDRSGKNTDDRFGRACAEQYKRFVDTLTRDEVRTIFASPKAFYLRMAAMMRARGDARGTDELLSRIAKMPREAENPKLAEYISMRSRGESKKLCIFGAGYHGRVLKFELEHRHIEVACFCDNDARKNGTAIEGVPCVTPAELEKSKDGMLVVIAADVSDAIEAQLKGLGFLHTTTKKKLDPLILETPPDI
jgi:glycosyltransferase involved in cell wall biosynthesis